MYKKAQTATPDLIISIVVFVVIIAIILITWNLYSSRLETNIAYNQMLNKAYQITNTLTTSPGTPNNWEENSSSVRIIGLATNNKILSTTKVNKFLNLPYNETRSLLRIEDYDFYFTINNLDDSVIKGAGEPPFPEYSVKIKRYVIYENEPKIIEFTLWK